MNRRSLLRKSGAVGGTLAALGAGSQPADAETQPDGPELSSVHEMFRAADDAMLRDLSDRGFIDGPTVTALDIQETARAPQDDESYGNTVTYTVDGESYTAAETKVSTEAEVAHVTVFPETGQSIVSVEGEATEPDRTDYGTGLPLELVTTTSHCEAGTKSCSCTDDQCDCFNFQRTNWSKCECSCGDSCTKTFYECSDCTCYPCCV